jgi:hypothetical protein
MSEPPVSPASLVNAGGSRRLAFRGYRPSPDGLIPAEARVDPDKFPEDEFPLFCPACNYELRGLPEPLCPECGRPFDRGRLLVEQYVIEQGKRCSGTSPLLNAASWLGLACVLSIQIGLVFVGPLLLRRNPFVIQSLPAAMPWVLGVLILASMFISWTAAWRQVRRRKQVRHLIQRVNEAMDRDTPAFQQAHVYSRWFWMLYFGTAAALVLFAYRCDHPGLNSFSRLSVPGLVIAALCIAVVVILHWRSRRIRRSK